jgi:hypothetical protein
MTEDQLETWMHNMIRACNRSTLDSDINVLKLIQHIENLYEKGRADEREACAKLCEQTYDKQIVQYPKGYYVDPNKMGEYSEQTAKRCAAAIRARGKK